MERFSKDLKNQIIKVINYERKEMIPIIKDEKSLMTNKNFVIYVKKSFAQIKLMKKNLN